MNYVEGRRNCIRRVLEDFEYRQPNYIISPYVHNIENENQFLAAALKQNNFHTYFERHYVLDATYSPDREFYFYSYANRHWTKGKMTFQIYTRVD